MHPKHQQLASPQDLRGKYLLSFPAGALAGALTKDRGDQRLTVGCPEEWAGKQGHQRAQNLQPNAASTKKGCCSVRQTDSLVRRLAAGTSEKGKQGAVWPPLTAKEPLSRRHVEEGTLGGQADV